VSRQIPYSSESEQALIGACLLNKMALEKAMKIVAPTEFYHPGNVTIFAKMVKMHGEGQSIDAVTLSEALEKDGSLASVGGSAYLMTAQSQTPSSSNAPKYAHIIVEKAAYRRAIDIASRLIEDAYEQASDPGTLIEWAKAELSAAGVQTDDLPSDLWVLDEFLDRPEIDRAQWCIPGLIREGWRIMIVAPEGIGKTVLLRQLAMAAAQGIHPLRFTPMNPCRSLIVDLENPDDSILDVCNPIREMARGEASEYDPTRAWLWHRPSGMNFRSAGS